MKKPIALLLAGVMAFGLMTGCNTAKVSGTPAIKVNSTTITKEAIDKRIDQTLNQYQLEKTEENVAMIKTSVIDAMVGDALVLKEAADRGIKGTTDEFKTLRDQVVQSVGSEEAYKEVLAGLGMTVEEYEAILKDQVVFNNLITALEKDIPVDAQAYYDAHIAEFAVPDQVSARHILVETEEEAQDIIARLDAGEDFATLAAEHSLDTYNKDQGGDLGYFSYETMVAPFSEVAFALEPGTYSKTPVATEFGYHIILVDNKQAAHTKTYDEVKDEIESSIKQGEVQSVYMNLVNDLQANAEIEYILDDYNPQKLAEAAAAAVEPTEQAPASAEDAGADTTVSEEAAPAGN